MPLGRALPWLLLLSLAAPLPARADFEAGVAAARAGDYERARREWQPLAEAGNRDAQFNLGLLYENGLGVAADGAAAAGWYRRAAEQDDRQAQVYLAEMYAKGLGVARDDAAALRWYRRAAELGHPAAQFNVGVFYALGRGVPPDDIEGYAWLEVGQENGAPPTDLLDVLKKNMSAERLAQAERRAADVRQRCKLP
ncbi:MAG TPA: tetratricopeptide repeat protein [Burkholderiales bacterium]|nr:tetratricopeptide repeat protein [Burkholderiales bacterium]